MIQNAGNGDRRIGHEIQIRTLPARDIAWAQASVSPNLKGCVTGDQGERYIATASHDALHYMHYNFCRIHKSLRVTPAMAAGVTDRVWDMSDVAALIATQEAPVTKRGPYKKKAA
jgi:hypothetical protein